MDTSQVPTTNPAAAQHLRRFRASASGAALMMSLAATLTLSACWFGNSPEKINQQIEDGKPAKALSILEEQLADTPDDAALNLLAIKARLALCHERNCVSETKGITPPLLNGIGKLANNITGPVSLAEDVSPIALGDVFTAAMNRYQSLSPQPSAVATLYNATPEKYQPAIASGLFQPALNQARKGLAKDAAQTLQALAAGEGAVPLPTTYTYSAAMLAAMFDNRTDAERSNLIALRSTSTPALPSTAAALLPWALLAEGKAASSTQPSTILFSLPERVTALQISNILDRSALSAIAQELLTTSNTPGSLQQWQEGWQGSSQSLALALQRTALAFDPNQPQLWGTYLPALVSATLGGETSSSMAGVPTTSLSMASITSTSGPQIAPHIFSAVQKLTDYPAVATPLIGLAGRIELSKPQQVELEKLSQALLIKAAGLGDVTSTLALAQTLPGVAQNNRQSVVPLLVKYIRENLREGNFTAATNTADLLTNTLKMDIEYAPLILEEFEEDMKRRKVGEALSAATPEMLLKQPEDAALDLGPLFTFMQNHFADQPKVITAQLTTLIAETSGTYGQPTAMYRLGSHFPEGSLTPEKQREWLGAALEQSLLSDTKVSGLVMAKTAAELAPLHSGLNLAPIMEAAIKRTSGLEDQRTLWQQATPQVREVLRAIRPEFVMLMQGIDALADKRLNTAAQALSGISDTIWRAEAKPFIEQFHERLLSLSGIYVPVSPAPALKTAAFILSPEGLRQDGGRLNMVSLTFISREGTAAESEPTAMRTNAAVIRRFELPVVYNFDSLSLPITAQSVAQAPGGGTFNASFGAIRNLRLQEGSNGNPILSATLSDGNVIPFVRTLVDPTQPLRPDGTYLLQTRLGNSTTSATQSILPPGSLLTFTTAEYLQPTPAGADTTAQQTYALSGTLRHPASVQPIAITGYFEPETLASTFSFSYPLPQSGQPARAAVRCQTLAGPITCGAHNLNGARQAYAALITGLQTRESLATAAAARNNLNAISSDRMLTNATTQQSALSAGASLISASGVTSGSLLPPPNFIASSTTATPTQVTPSQPAAVTPTAISSTAPAPSAPTANDVEDEGEESAGPATDVTPTKHIFSDEPEPGAFVNNSGSRLTSATTPAQTDVEPGVFINNSGARNATPTQP